MTALAIVLLAAAGLAPALEPGRALRIEPETARAGFVLGATLHEVRGETRAVSGHVEILDRRDGALALDGEVVILAATLDTGNKRRDRKMREQSLAADEHPEIVFVPRAYTPRPDAPDADRDGGSAGELAGELRIRGVTRPVTLDVRVAAAAGGVVVDGGVRIVWADFGVPNPSVLLLRVERSVDLSFHVELLPAPLPAPDGP